MSESLVDEWVEKAEADYEAARDLHRRRVWPLPDIVCYHCQQCAEKYLKALLVAKGASPPRIHDLVELTYRCAQYDASMARLMPAVTTLDAYGVEERYPGMSATKQDAQEALGACRRVRTDVRSNLGL